MKDLMSIIYIGSTADKMDGVACSWNVISLDLSMAKSLKEKKMEKQFKEELFELFTRYDSENCKLIISE